MAREKPEDILRHEWNGISKNWYGVYQWPSLANSTYTETICSIILNDYASIELRAEGLRKRTFKYPEHKGQGHPQTSEKRFCRALYNAKRVHLLGDVLDYEIPLKEEQRSDHGDIDVLSWNDDGLLITEAKAYNSQGSLLKALLQAFTYTSLVGTEKARFTSSFEVPKETELIPAVLVFETADEGSNLRIIDTYTNLKSLINRLNQSLAASGSGKIEFYLIEGNDKEPFKNCMEMKSDEQGRTRVMFVDGFTPRPVRIDVKFDD